MLAIRLEDKQNKNSLNLSLPFVTGAATGASLRKHPPPHHPIHIRLIRTSSSFMIMNESEHSLSHITTLHSALSFKLT